MKKILAVFAVIIIAVSAGCYSYYVKTVKPQEQYEEAEKVFATGDYDQALELYEACGDYEDASQKASGIKAYKEGVALMEKGELKKAYKSLKKVNKDLELIKCDRLLNRCKTYQDFNFNKKSGNYVLHVKTYIKEDATIHMGAYLDEHKKAKKDLFEDATYEKIGGHIEWTVDDPDDDALRISYSYSVSEKVLTVAHFTKEGAFMQSKNYMYF